MCSCQRQQVPQVLLAVPVDDTQKMLIFFQTTVYCIQEIIYCNNCYQLVTQCPSQTTSHSQVTELCTFARQALSHLPLFTLCPVLF